eukprot:GILI01012202.1.p1 GENE.GILI01012202.1~~GILI01012202.1.p1  ORF type:complete len:247 (-),score=50.59 GILI01012202.1:166-906(-)
MKLGVATLVVITFISFQLAHAIIPSPDEALKCTLAACEKLEEDMNELTWEEEDGKFRSPSTSAMHALFHRARNNIRAGVVGPGKPITTTDNLSILYYRCNGETGVIVGYKKPSNIVTPAVSVDQVPIFPREEVKYSACGVKQGVTKGDGQSECYGLYVDPDITVWRHFKAACDGYLATSKAYLFTELDMCRCCRSAIDADLRDLYSSAEIRSNILTIFQGRPETGRRLTWNKSGHKQCPENLCFGR